MISMLFGALVFAAGIVFERLLEDVLNGYRRDKELSVASKEFKEPAAAENQEIIVLVSKKEDNTGMILVRVSDSLVKTGANAGKIVGEIAQQCGGKGGGKPNFAQGGAKDLTNIDSILASIEAQF